MEKQIKIKIKINNQSIIKQKDLYIHHIKV